MFGRYFDITTISVRLLSINIATEILPSSHLRPMSMLYGCVHGLMRDVSRIILIQNLAGYSTH